MTTTIRLQREAFDVGAEAALLTRSRTDIGAVVTFTGLCRADENGEPIAALTLEHYPDMAEAEIARHVEEARARWPLLGVSVIHRYGRIAPGEVIVAVVTASSHREAAFAAASFLMDYLKTRAPFWKQVEKVSGKNWVDAKDTDDAAAARWSEPPPRREPAKEGGGESVPAFGIQNGGTGRSRSNPRDRPMSHKVWSVRLASSVRALALTCQAAKPLRTRCHRRSGKAFLVSMALSEVRNLSLFISLHRHGACDGQDEMTLVRLHL